MESRWELLQRKKKMFSLVYNTNCNKKGNVKKGEKSWVVELHRLKIRK